MAAVIDPDRLRGKAAASRSPGGEGGGTMDDVLKRLGVLEHSVGAMRSDVSEIKATLPHLATHAQLSESRLATGAQLSELRLATESQLNEHRLATGAQLSELRLATETQLNELRVTTEAQFSELRTEVGVIKAALPQFATEAKLNEVRAILPHLATVAQLKELEGALKTMEVHLVRWVIGTALTLGTVTIGVARFLD